MHAHTKLVAVNGPSDITITNIALAVTYHNPVGSFAVQEVKLYFNDFAILQKDFQLTGPRPPVRVKPYDLLVWKFPRWDGLLCRGHALAYRLVIDTAHMDKPAYSDVRYFGPHLKSILTAVHTKPRISCEGGLSFNLHLLPDERATWARAVLHHAKTIED